MRQRNANATNFCTLFGIVGFVRDGKYSSFVALLVMALIVSVVAGLWMLRYPSSIQSPLPIPNFLRRSVTTSAIPAPASAAALAQTLTTPAPASPRVRPPQIDVSVPPSRGTEARAVVEAPPTETASVPGPIAGSVAGAVVTGAPKPLQSSEIYSAHDADVIPPKAKHPQQFGFQRFDAAPTEIVTFEVIVDEQGHIESARVMNASPTLAGTMLHTMALQSIRSWDFEPALRAGRPVKFRFEILIPWKRSRGCPAGVTMRKRTGGKDGSRALRL